MQLSGPLSFANVASLWVQHAPVVAGSHEIDLSAVTVVDSAGIALLTALKRAAGAQCHLNGTPPAVRALAEAYGVGALFS